MRIESLYWTSIGGYTFGDKLIVLSSYTQNGYVEYFIPYLEIKGGAWTYRDAYWKILLEFEVNLREGDGEKWEHMRAINGVKKAPKSSE